jgi:RNA polymerase sigma factor (sigma-70 family)
LQAKHPAAGEKPAPEGGLQYPLRFIRLQDMDGALRIEWRMAEDDQRISEIVEKEGTRLRNFIRRRVRDPRDAEDLLQDVFSKLVEANRLLMPIDHITGWLFQVARNRITDLLRKKQPLRFSDLDLVDQQGQRLEFPDLLPSPDLSPDARYRQSVLFEELELAIRELPPEQREVFVAHELRGQSFREMAAETGVNVSTLLSRKRYAVMRLRERLEEIQREFGKG